MGAVRSPYSLDRLARHSLAANHADPARRFLDGTIDAEGKLAFNAFCIVSFDPARNACSFRSHAMGRSGDFAFKPTADGFSWDIPAGPMTIRYTTVIRNGTWHEVGDYIRSDKPPQRFFEMTLQRIGDSDWPGAGAVRAK